MAAGIALAAGRMSNGEIARNGENVTADAAKDAGIATASGARTGRDAQTVRRTGAETMRDVQTATRTTESRAGAMAADRIIAETAESRMR